MQQDAAQRFGPGGGWAEVAAADTEFEGVAEQRDLCDEGGDAVEVVPVQAGVRPGEQVEVVVRLDQSAAAQSTTKTGKDG
ncbi:hypothetical protein ACIBTP_42160 [Streptomyces avidinii]|uniref:hypothetical protein n=1 Tax=Streptomyces avidinii TaxID=1895 RepID=UPI0037B8709B